MNNDDRTREHCLVCNFPVRRWRECGRKPCTKVIAYCREHGGEDLAGWEMAAHIVETHGVELR